MLFSGNEAKCVLSQSSGADAEKMFTTHDQIKMHVLNATRCNWKKINVSFI